MKRVLLATLSSVALAISAAHGSARSQPAPTAPAPNSYGAWGVDLTARDPSVSPGDSFFDHANGGWYAAAQIPADQPTAGVGYDLHNLTQAQLRGVIEDSARAADTPVTTKIGALYASFMDEARVEQLDAKPLAAALARLRAAKNRDELAELMGRPGFGTGLYDEGVIPDLKGPKVYTFQLGISGLGLPDREYYLQDQFKSQRDAYQAYVGRTLAMAGWDTANSKALAESVLAFERGIAEARWTLAQQRDLDKMYQVMSPAQLAAFAPGFDWTRWLRAMGTPGDLQRIIVGENTAVPKVARLFSETPVETLKAWMAFHQVSQASPYLSKRFVDSRFDFIKLLSGQTQLRPRWQRGVSLVDGSLGEAVGQEYVRRHFPASSKAKMERMVANLHKAMRARIANATWMSDATKAEAYRKLDNQVVKVGYPDRWRDYSTLRVNAADLYGNVERASAFTARDQLDRLGKPVDREEWLMTPQTVNAYFNPLVNEIVFPAAMLQAPMFSAAADDAVNYGAIGSVIGHEITHAFDDLGRRFDHKGEMRDWWTSQDAARFQTEADKLIAQYDGYEVLPGAKVNGKQTIGENIGDHAGLLVAYDAYRATLNGKEAPVIDGLTGDQRFFLAFAQGWRNKVRDDAARMLVASDVHSPYRWRVDGTLRNIDRWYAAFDVKPGDRMYLPPEKRARVW